MAGVINKKNVVIAIAALIILAAVAAIFFLINRNSNQASLFEDLSDKELGLVINKLDQLKISYKLDGQGRVLVGADKEAEIKANLAAAGFELNPQQGFELFDQAEYGLNEFSQNILLQRALQGELAKTISVTEGITSARVHLVLPQQGLFRDKKVAKASVSLILAPGVRLSKEQIVGIQEVIASSVEGLERDQVVIADSTGRILSEEISESEFKNSLSKKQQLEKYFEQKIEKLLSDVLGKGRFSVSVAVDQDLSERQLETSILLPVPDKGYGFLVRDKVTGRGFDDRKVDDSKHGVDYEKSYEFGRKSEKITIEGGAITHISVSVAVPMETPTDTLPQIKTLVSNAIGLIGERGDRVDVFAVLPESKNFDGGKLQVNTEIPELSKSSLLSPPDSQSILHERLNGIGLKNTTIYFGIALAFLALILAFIWFVKGGAKKNNLHPEEREKLLAEIRQWLAE